VKNIRGLVFWPTFVFLGVVVGLSFKSPESLALKANSLKAVLLNNCQALYGWSGLIFLILLLVAAVSPLGKIKIGGEEAKPLFSFWNWFAIALGTTTAVGILFWASAEPIFHMTQPPKSLGLEPNSEASGVFALSTLFMHWTLIPHAIYTLPALLFALAFFNDKQPYSIGSCLYPFQSQILGTVTDSVALFCLVVGMATSLATGILSIGGGVAHITNFASSPKLSGGIGLVLLSLYIFSTISGLDKGIRRFSHFNTVLFLFLILFFLSVGPTRYIVAQSFKSLGQFLSTFWSRSTFLAFDKGKDNWVGEWPVFYLANWLAWAPVTGTFLGRISYGYRVRTFIAMFLVVLASFGAIWISVFGTVAVHMHLVQKLPLATLLKTHGAESLMFYVLSQFPLAKWLIPVFLVGLCISCVTATDSNTIAMAAMSSKDVNPENPNPSLKMKLLWGTCIGLLAIAMLFSQGLEGIKTLSVLGGFPALIFEILCAGVLVLRVVKSFNEKSGET
jgi:choline-glycine betaine transporter